jgi:hypothetical protein
VASALAAVVAAAGWAVLVRSAIAAGSAARDSGSGADWARTAALTAGAAACLLVALLMLARLVSRRRRRAAPRGRHRR